MESAEPHTGLPLDVIKLILNLCDIQSLGIFAATCIEFRLLAWSAQVAVFIDSQNESNLLMQAKHSSFVSTMSAPLEIPSKKIKRFAHRIGPHFATLKELYLPEMVTTMIHDRSFLSEMTTLERLYLGYPNFLRGFGMQEEAPQDDALSVSLRYLTRLSQLVITSYAPISVENLSPLSNLHILEVSDRHHQNRRLDSIPFLQLFGGFQAESAEEDFGMSDYTRAALSRMQATFSSLESLHTLIIDAKSEHLVPIAKRMRSLKKLSLAFNWRVRASMHMNELLEKGDLTLTTDAGNVVCLFDEGSTFWQCMCQESNADQNGISSVVVKYWALFKSDPVKYCSLHPDLCDLHQGGTALQTAVTCRNLPMLKFLLSVCNAKIPEIHYDVAPSRLQASSSAKHNLAGLLLPGLKLDLFALTAFICDAEFLKQLLLLKKPTSRSVAPFMAAAAANPQNSERWEILLDFSQDWDFYENVILFPPTATEFSSGVMNLIQFAFLEMCNSENYVQKSAPASDGTKPKFYLLLDVLLKQLTSSDDSADHQRNLKRTLEEPVFPLGKTALHLVCSARDSSLVDREKHIKRLIELGASPFVANDMGLLPVDYYLQLPQNPWIKEFGITPAMFLDSRTPDGVLRYRALLQTPRRGLESFIADLMAFLNDSKDYSIEDVLFELIHEVGIDTSILRYFLAGDFSKQLSYANSLSSTTIRSMMTIPEDKFSKTIAGYLAPRKLELHSSDQNLRLLIGMNFAEMKTNFFAANMMRHLSLAAGPSGTIALEPLFVAGLQLDDENEIEQLCRDFALRCIGAVESLIERLPINRRLPLLVSIAKHIQSAASYATFEKILFTLLDSITNETVLVELISVLRSWIHPNASREQCTAFWRQVRSSTSMGSLLENLVLKYHQRYEKDFDAVHVAAAANCSLECMKTLINQVDKSASADDLYFELVFGYSTDPFGSVFLAQIVALFAENSFFPTAKFPLQAVLPRYQVLEALLRTLSQAPTLAASTGVFLSLVRNLVIFWSVTSEIPLAWRAQLWKAIINLRDPAAMSSLLLESPPFLSEIKEIFERNIHDAAISQTYNSMLHNRYFGPKSSFASSAASDCIIPIHKQEDAAKETKFTGATNWAFQAPISSMPVNAFGPVSSPGSNLFGNNFRSSFTSFNSQNPPSGL